MRRAMWEDNEALSEEMKVFLRQRDAAEEGVKACMASEYPPGDRVKVETSHKGQPLVIFGLVISHKIELGMAEVEIENERTGHLRKFNILTSKIRREAAPPKIDKNQAAIDAFMADDGDEPVTADSPEEDDAVD